MKYLTLLELLQKAIEIAWQKTYYPEKIRKPFLIRLLDNIRWVFKYGEYNGYYNLYGMDIKGSRVLHSEYIALRTFERSRDILNYNGKNYSQNSLLKDKLLFSRYMNEIGILTPTVFAIIIDGKVFDLNFKMLNIEYFKERKDYFIKKIDGLAGESIIWIYDFNDYDKRKELFSKGRFIIQESIVQHEEMNRLNSQSINTLRLVTTFDKKSNIRLFSKLLRVGTLKSGKVDNWTRGGLAVGIKEDGHLKKYGYYRPEFGTKEYIHPDSKIEFSSFKIPFFTQAIEMVINAHKYFYGLFSIGWDIAITEKGCIIIEGNDNWGNASLQVCDRAFKREWENLTK